MEIEERTLKELRREEQSRAVDLGMRHRFLVLLLRVDVEPLSPMSWGRY